MKLNGIQTDLQNYYESSLVMFAPLNGSKSPFFAFSNQTLHSVEFQQQHLEPFRTSAMQTDERRISKRMAQHLVGGLTCYGEVIERVGQVGVQRFLFVADERAVCLQQEVARTPVLYVFTCNEAQRRKREEKCN